MLIIKAYLSGEKQSPKLINTLASESNIASDWFTKNETIIKPGKFQAVELLGIHLDDKLNFNLYVSKISRSAANQLHALKNKGFVREQYKLNLETPE